MFGNDTEEVEEIQNKLQAVEMRQRKATDLRRLKQQEILSSAHNLTGRVEEKLTFKSQKVENDYYTEFEKNVLKRAKMEELKKQKRNETNE